MIILILLLFYFFNPVFFIKRKIEFCNEMKYLETKSIFFMSKYMRVFHGSLE